MKYINNKVESKMLKKAIMSGSFTAQNNQFLKMVQSRTFLTYPNKNYIVSTLNLMVKSDYGIGPREP